jgi:hypothetical protein
MDPLTLSTLLAAALPAAFEGIKGLAAAASRRWLGLSVDDEIKLKNADIERLKALAALDAPGGTPSPWVVDLRAAFRYVSAGGLIMIGSVMIGAGLYMKADEIVLVGVQVATFPFSFIFGERMVLTLNNRPK